MFSDFIEKTLIEASKIATASFGKVEHTVKSDDNNQVLTETDLSIGDYIVSQITKQFPSHNVIDEEAGAIDHGSDTTWVVDPIDGTSNFAAGLPMYGIMIGVLVNDQPYAGGVSLPALGQIYLAEKGTGAFCNGKQIKVTDEQDLSQCLIAYGIDGHPEKPELTTYETEIINKLVLNIRNLRTSNSAFDLMMVARGSYGGNLNRTSKIWDNVAPQVIIEEAGGRYTQFNGLEVDYTSPLERLDQNFTVCTGAPALHVKLQNLIKTTS